MAPEPSESEVRVGTIYRIPSCTNELLALVVVHSNSWFLGWSVQSLQREPRPGRSLASIHSPIAVQTNFMAPVSGIDTVREIVVHYEAPAPSIRGGDLAIALWLTLCPIEGLRHNRSNILITQQKRNRIPRTSRSRLTGPTCREPDGEQSPEDYSSPALSGVWVFEPRLGVLASQFRARVRLPQRHC
jgi:hypothetical protein